MTDVSTPVFPSRAELAYLAALELVGLLAVSVGAGALGGRSREWTVAGIAGASAAAAILILDQLVVTRHVFVSGGSGTSSTAWWFIAMVLALLAFLHATRDPATDVRGLLRRASDLDRSPSITPRATPG